MSANIHSQKVQTANQSLNNKPAMPYLGLSLRGMRMRPSMMVATMKEKIEAAIVLMSLSIFTPMRRKILKSVDREKAMSAKVPVTEPR